MIFITYLARIEQIDQLIRLRATGTPKEMAERLNISGTVLWDIIKLMKELGASIYYDKYSRCYCYSEAVKFEYSFKRLTNDKLDKIAGGKKNSCFFIKFGNSELG